MAEGDNSGSSSTAGQNNSGGPRMFTQDEVNRMMEDRLARDRRTREDEARKAQDASRSEIEKLTASVTELTEKHKQAEAKVARRDAAEKYNLPKNIAAKLTGSDPDDLDREARDWVAQLAELGVPVKDGKIVAKPAGSEGTGGGQGGNGNGGGGTGGTANGSDGKGGGDGKNDGGQSSTGGDGADAGNNGAGAGSGQQDSGGNASKGRSLLGGRPTESLRSGAAPAGGGGDTVDAGALADSILGRSI